MKQWKDLKSSVWMKRLQNRKDEITGNESSWYAINSVSDSVTGKVTEMASSDNLLRIWKMSEELIWTLKS
jgi:hypothetical protein